MLQIIKKFFVKKEEITALQPDNGHQHKDLLHLFELDLANLCLFAFEQGRAEVQPNGDIIQHLYSRLDKMECGLFDSINLKVIGGENLIVNFKATKPEQIDFLKLKQFMDNLYDIYGTDNNNKGRYNETDEQEYVDEELYSFFGRNWLDYPKHKYPVSLRRSEQGLSLSIWGIRCKAGTDF